MSWILNAKQEELAALGIEDILVIAPAGCGKTEALAGRAAALHRRGDVKQPRRILAVTFSNRAKKNLVVRLRAQLGSDWQQLVTVTNFHGLAARVIRAHGPVIGIARDVLFPEERWRNRVKRELGINYRNSNHFEETLRQIKRETLEDDLLMARLEATCHGEAIAFEKLLRAEGRLDYDDLIRHAVRILALPQVACLYQAHFGVVLVDEVQDLTLMQLGLVESVGQNRVTYAGDPAQGIYSFAGAQPDQVFTRIRAKSPRMIEFDQSYRSSPAVLAAVNALAKLIGSTELRCADPSRWMDSGRVLLLQRSNPEEEAGVLIDFLQALLADQPNLSVGVVVRRSSRLSAFRSAATSADLAFEDWGAPTHIPWVIDLLKRNSPKAVARKDLDAADQLIALENSCRAALESSDVDGFDEIASAIEALHELLDKGMSLEEAVATCRSTPVEDALVRPGVTLLNGHIGKGQEFDWIVVLGLEDGHIPDFRATSREEIEEELRVLHVMVSRARSGLVLARSEWVATKSGLRAAECSPWLAYMEGAATGTI